LLDSFPGEGVSIFSKQYLASCNSGFAVYIDVAYIIFWMKKCRFYYFLSVVFNFEEGLQVLRMKLAGELYDDMTDTDGKPIVKPGSDIGVRQQKARAKRNKVVRMSAGKICKLIALLIRMKFDKK
jgi:hypothetical protein